MPVTVWHYPQCSTCRQALKWLAARRIEVEAVDIVTAPPSAKTLRELHRRSGLPLARFFNTAGASYRTGNFKERLITLSEAEAFSSLAADGKLIKRPLVDTGTAVLVGFDEEQYRRTFAE